MSLRRNIWIGLGVFLAAMWILFAFSVQQEFSLARRSAFATTSTIAKLVEETAQSSIGRISDMSAGLIGYVTSFGFDTDLAPLLERQRRIKPELFRAIEVLDTSGELVAEARATAHRSADSRNFDSDRLQTTTIRIGLPRLVDGADLIPMTAPLQTDDGHILGSIMVEASPSYFAGFYADLGLPPGASAMLFRSDGPVLASNDPRLGTLGRTFPNSKLWTLLPHSPSGSYEVVTGTGTRRLISYLASPNLPFVVTIGLTAETVFAEAWRHVVMYGLVGVGLSLAVVLFATVMLRQLEQRAHTERALEIAAAAVGSTGSGVVITDATRSEPAIVQCNPAFERMSGLSSLGLVGRGWTDILDPGTPDSIVAELREAFRSGREAGADVLLRCVEGNPAEVELRLAPIADRTSGKAGHFVMLVTDISERKAAEAALVSAKEEAEAASRTKSEFLANMSHELRTPLNAILGFSEIMADEQLGPMGNERYRDYAADIRMSGSHLLELINDILDLSKIEASSLELDEKKVDIGRVIQVCTRLVADRADKAGVTITCELGANLPRVWADELRLKQILLNLLSNAVKFSKPAHSVLVTARLEAEGGIVIMVADQGCGMNAEEIELALQPFRQLDSSLSRRAEGTGLGLPLAQRLAVLHGAALDIESAPGIGTSVVLRLPPTRTCRLKLAV